MGWSFVVAAVNGMIADLLLHRWGWPNTEGVVNKKPSIWASVVFTSVLVAGTVAYGQYQLHRGYDK